MKYLRMRGVAGLTAAAALLLGSIPVLAAMMGPPSISVVSPAPGAIVRSASIPVAVAVRNFKIDCADMGKTAGAMGEGHIHAMLDGMDMAHLASVACSDHFSISGQGVKPGKHFLTVMLADDAHAMNSMPVTVPFTYEPSMSNPLPGAMTGGKPTVRILSPQNGASVGTHFNLVVAVNHFDLSCNLEGKQDLAGWGHLHVFVQQNGETSAAPSAPMVAMMQTPEGMKMGKMLMQQTGMTMDQLKPMMMMAEPGMIGMPCSKQIPVNLSTWHHGPAKIIVLLANNDHMPTMGVAPASISVNVK